MKQTLLLLIAVFCFASAALAQSTPSALANLPDADTLVYISPQRILNDAVPKAVPAADVAKMQAAFADIKRGIGVDPSTIEYIVLAVRFHKPAADLSFVAPDVMAVIGGDFSSESLFSLAQMTFQDKLRLEKLGSRTIGLLTIDPIAAEAAKNPVLKPFTEIGAVALTPNSLAIGNLRYLKSAIEAADGAGRIKPETLQSLLRDPNVLMAATGAPLASFARSFGMMGTETTSRDSRCDTNFGNFYAAVTMSGANYSLRGAMAADNPDTARIIANLLSGLMKTDISAIPDKTAQTILQSLKLTARESEVVIEADIPAQMIADLVREQTKPKDAAAPATSKKPAPRPARRTKRRN